MKKFSSLLLIAMFVAGLYSCTGQKENAEEKARKGWTLVWEDDFDQSLDASAWSKTTKGKLHMNRYMSQNDGLYLVQEGNLVLRAVGNSAPNDTMPFLTGGITREGVKLNKARRIEVRARMNPANGATSYFSLLPADKAKNISIDFMERYGVDEFIYQSVSSEYTTTEGMPDNPPSSALVGVNPNLYHIYSMEKYPDSLVFFVDDIRTKKYPRILTDMPGQFPFDDQDFELFLGIRLNNDTDPAGLPADLLIDWVRVYEPAPPALPAGE
ncbi:MAG: glycoside hydrolase family 16 protein [Proteiniphilum sp.]|nr:glycoside hydrolase family 16 protein [Proteiniphilum sp.]